MSNPTKVGIFIGVLGWSYFGWVLAHSIVATECKRLGAFYVGDTVYECREKNK